MLRSAPSLASGAGPAKAGQARGRLARVLPILPLLLCLSCTSQTSVNGEDPADQGGATSGGSSGRGTGGGAGTGEGPGGQSGSSGGVSSGGHAGNPAGGGSETGGSGGNSETGGSGGGSETGGSGGGSGLALGAPCTAGTQCASGSCADGVCCDDACEGPCTQCSPAGHCEAPADDAACGEIACDAPADPCRQYDSTQLSSDRCLRPGVCKTNLDCPFVPGSLGASCGEGRLCDGQGSCVTRTVKCGSDTCDLGVEFCCVLSDQGSSSCVPIGSACGENPTPDSSNTGIPVTCDEHADCEQGTGCCLADVQGSYALECKAWCPGMAAFGENLVICSTTAPFTGPCPSGKTCGPEAQGLLPWDWQICQ